MGTVRNCLALKKNGMLWVRRTKKTKEMGPKPGGNPGVLRTPTSPLASCYVKSRLTLHHEPRGCANIIMKFSLSTCQDLKLPFEYQSYLAPTAPLRMCPPTQDCTVIANQVDCSPHGQVDHEARLFYFVLTTSNVL